MRKVNRRAHPRRVKGGSTTVKKHLMKSGRYIVEPVADGVQVTPEYADSDFFTRGAFTTMYGAKYKPRYIETIGQAAERSDKVVDYLVGGLGKERYHDEERRKYYENIQAKRDYARKRRLSLVVKEAQAAYNLSPERKAKVAEYQKEYQNVPDVKSSRDKYRKEYREVPEHKETMAAYAKEYREVPEHKETMVEYQRDYYKKQRTPEKTANLIERQRTKYHSPESIKNRNTPEYKAIISERNRKSRERLKNENYSQT